MYMKTLVQINSVCSGSTGKIMCSIADEAKKKGYLTYNFFGRGKPKKSDRDIKFEGKLSFYFHILLARLGFNGHGSYFATKKLVRQLKKINPDIIHMHNIHGYYLNIKVLFKYLKKDYKGEIFWTLHDCWTFTGHCSHFSYVKCNKWMNQCFNCPQLSKYPKEIIDTTRKEYLLKKELFTQINNLTIITPSIWLANIVKKSFLKDYKIIVKNNTIDKSIFKKYSTEELEKTYKKYNIPTNKNIILGVANIWEERKGLNDFIELSKIISKDYKIILVGVDKKIAKIIPNDIIKIQRTDDQIDLAKLYNIALVLFNPTYEDNYPTVNLESVACGTPVITYDTGGSPESMLEFGRVTDKKVLFENFESFIEEMHDLKSK